MTWYILLHQYDITFCVESCGLCDQMLVESDMTKTWLQAEQENCILDLHLAADTSSYHCHLQSK